jgi:hypothetical protein
MQIYLRHVDDLTAAPFTECAHDELDSVIALIQRSGGVYAHGDLCPFNSYQLVLDEGSAYAEIIVGEDG